MSEIKKAVGRYVPGSLSMKRAPAYWVWRSAIETIRFPFFSFVCTHFASRTGLSMGRDLVVAGTGFRKVVSLPETPPVRGAKMGYYLPYYPTMSGLPG